MKCPKCGSELQSGRVEKRWFWLTKLAILFSFGANRSQIWWFCPEGGGEETRVVVRGQPGEAFRCASCATVVLPQASAQG
jgi:hypothetical protein